jgi:hypothetical protein
LQPYETFCAKRKQDCSFLKKRTKKLFPVCARDRPAANGKSLFASFSSEKEDASLLK